MKSPRIKASKTCVVCGAKFEARADAASCSDACRALKHRGKAPLGGPRLYKPRERGRIYEAFTWMA